MSNEQMLATVVYVALIVALLWAAYRLAKDDQWPPMG